MTLDPHTRGSNRPALLLLAALALFGSTGVQARELWVDTLSLGGTCSDAYTRDQNGQATPWCNLGPAGDQAIAGDVVTVRRGTYTRLHTCSRCYDEFVFEVVNSGTSDAWITYRAFPGEKVVVSGSGGVSHGIGVLQDRNFGELPRFIRIEGFEVSNFGPDGFCVWVRSTSDVVISNMDIHDCTLGAVELHDTARVTVENSSVHDNAMSGWTSAVDLYKCRENNVVRGNRIWNNSDTDAAETEGHGIIMDVCKDYGGSALIENNVIWNNEGWCFVANWSDNSTVRNNTCWKNGNGRADTGEIIIDQNNHSIYNNITVPRDGRLGLAVKSGTGNVFEHNLVQGGNWLLTWPENLYSINADPLLANPGAGDFHLTANSPAIDSGDNTNMAATDADGIPRPQDGSGLGYAMVDLGAYEYVTGGSVVTPTPPPPQQPPADPAGSTTSGTSTSGGGGCSIRAGQQARSFPTHADWGLLALFIAALGYRSVRRGRRPLG